MPAWYRPNRAATQVRATPSRWWARRIRPGVGRIRRRRRPRRLEVTSIVSGNPSGEVERLESWQLPAYLSALRSQGVAEVTWNRETIGLDVAGERATPVSPTATVV